MTNTLPVLALSLVALGGCAESEREHGSGKEDARRSTHSVEVGACHDARQVLGADEPGVKEAAEAWHACVAKANRTAVPAIDKSIDVAQFGSSAVQIDEFEAAAETFCTKVSKSFVGEFTGHILPECRGMMSTQLALLIDHYVSFGARVPLAELPLDRHGYMACYDKLDPAIDAAVSTADYIQAYGEMASCVLQTVHDMTDLRWIDQIKLDSSREVALQIMNDAYAAADAATAAACTLVHNTDDNAGGTAADITVAECGANAAQLLGDVIISKFADL